MRWLMHGNLTEAAAAALRRHGHAVQRPQDIGLAADLSASELFEAAQAKQLELITNDAELSAAPFENAIPFNRTLVYLQLEGGDVEQDDAIDRLFTRYKRLSPGRMYTVTAARVKIRQLPNQRLA
jgi:hypothetical protein